MADDNRPDNGQDASSREQQHRSQDARRQPQDPSHGSARPQGANPDYDFRYMQQSNRAKNVQRAARGSSGSGAQRGQRRDGHNSAAQRNAARRDAARNAARGSRSSVSAKEKARAAASAKAAADAKAAASAKAAAKAASKDYSRSAYVNDTQSVTSDYSAANYNARNKRMSTGKKVAIGIVCTLVIALAGLGIAAAVWYGNIANNIKGNEDITNLVAPAANEPYYVLLMGSDSREGFEVVDAGNSGERADSIMVARVDEKNQKVSIISVPRDLRVNIPGHGYCKINSAIEHGGYNLLITKLNEILGIKINYYATVYFTGFLELVDTVGGVTVAVPEGTATYNMDESAPDIILPAGDEVLLNGEEALVLARCRHGWPIDQGAYAMGDYQRTLNQRNLIKAIARKVLEQDITKMPALVESLSKSVETNMSVDKIIALAQNMKGMDIETMEAAQLPIGASTINGEWEALMYQDVFELMDKNFKEGNPLFAGLEGFNSESNDDDVHGNYIDGPIYAYTTYSAKYGSPYAEGYVPSSMTQEAIDRTKSGITH